MKATIEIKGMVHEAHEYEGDSPEEIIFQLYGDQDLDCLVRMGPMFGEDVSELERFVDKFHSGDLSFDDIKNLDISLSIGTIKCTSIQE